MYTTNPNNYRSFTYRDSATEDYSDYCCADAFINYEGTSYYILGTESTLNFTTDCDPVYTYRYYKSEGDIPLSVDPPVVVQ
ncbi:MAG: hypothetical protein IJY86_12700 [Clostridia bacterium]|nr:hypothetical protein [Clostridia bacterium]MBQ8899310.1 hypothetical protein [Clostridia bacterium]